MSKRWNTTMPLFLFLVGTAAFSLSTLPSAKDNGHFMVTSLSSEFASDCDNMGQSINRGANSASCVINPVASSGDLGKVSGRVDVQLVDVPRRDPKDFNKIVTRKEWQRTTEIVCEGDHCPKEPIKITKNYDQDDYNKLSRMDDFESGARKMMSLMKQVKEEAKKEQEQEEKRRRCEIDSNGRKLEGKLKMNCRVARLDKMDEEEAADYYEEYILPDIQNMVGSSDVRKQRAGMALLRELNASGAGGDFVKESVADLARFGQFKYQSDQQKLQIMAMNPNDPRRPAMIEKMRTSQFQADMYFRSRGIKVDNDEWGVGANGFDYAQVLADNLSNFRNRIDQNYDEIWKRYQIQFQNPAAMQPQVMNQQQQMANAWPQNTQFQPNGQYPPVPPQSSQFQQQQQQQYQQQQLQQQQARPVTTLQSQKSSVAIPRSVTRR